MALWVKNKENHYNYSTADNYITNYIALFSKFLYIKKQVIYINVLNKANIRFSAQNFVTLQRVNILTRLQR